MEFKEALKILELNDGFSLEELKKVYYKKIIDNHPDKYVNSSEEIKKFQHKRTQEINSAYQCLINYSDSKNDNYGFGSGKEYKDYEYINDYYELQKLWHSALDMQEKGKYGLAIRLFEIGINLCFTKNYQSCHRLYQLQRVCLPPFTGQK